MSHGLAADLSQVELQIELDLICDEDDDTMRPIDQIEIDDIFSSSEGDYKLFELDCHHCIHEDMAQNQSIWGSYFDKIAQQQQKYLSESQNVLYEMKQTCVDTLTLCKKDTTHIEMDEKQSQLNRIEANMTPDLITIEEDIITTNPCIPCHVRSAPHWTPNQPQSIIIRDNYNTKLQNLENELNQVTQSHHQLQQQQSCSSVKWSTLLHQSKELYDEYLETTHRIKRDKQRWRMLKYFADWKVVCRRNKQKKLRLIELTYDMERIVHRLVERAVSASHTLTIWTALILKYQHKTVMNRIRCSVSWKACVVDYIMFHYKETYASIMNHRKHFKWQCLPFMGAAAEAYQKRRKCGICVMKISIWYKHQSNKRKLVRTVRGIHKLCEFRKQYIENPLLITKHIFMAWMRYTKWKHCVLQSIRNKWMKHAMHETICYLRYETQYHRSKRTIVCFRNTKRRRIRYLKYSAAVCIQSYFRMFHIRSITNEVQNKLSEINDIFAVYISRGEAFKTLDASEYILDKTIIDWDLKPLSNPPSPHFECKSLKSSDDASSSCHELESENESQSDDDTESDTESDAELHKSEPQNQWQFENEDVAKAWLRRKKKFKRKKKTTSAQYWFHKRKARSHSFGVSNRFKHNKKKKQNKMTKPKLVKFGCSRN